MFYDLFIELCRQKGIAPTRAAVEIGLSKSTPTTWKKKGLTPQGATLQKIADYFDVTTDYLLGTETEKDPATGSEVSEDDLKFALFGGEATDKQLDEVRRFAQFIKERDRK